MADCITPRKVRMAMDSFSPYEAADSDCFPPCVLQKLPERITNYLILEAAITNCWLPESWKRMKIVFIPKARNLILLGQSIPTNHPVKVCT